MSNSDRLLGKERILVGVVPNSIFLISPPTETRVTMRCYYRISENCPKSIANRTRNDLKFIYNKTSHRSVLESVEHQRTISYQFGNLLGKRIIFWLASKPFRFK